MKNYLSLECVKRYTPIHDVNIEKKWFIVLHRMRIALHEYVKYLHCSNSIF